MSKIKKEINYKKAREELRQWTIKYSCNIQTSKSGLWPCGTCFIHLLNQIGLRAGKEEYNDKNEDHDRHNEVWRAILQIRDAEIK